jgi:hypothetical protein
VPVPAVLPALSPLSLLPPPQAGRTSTLQAAKAAVAAEAQESRAGRAERGVVMGFSWRVSGWNAGPRRASGVPTR